MEKTLPLGVAFVSAGEVTRYVPNFTINVGQLGRAKRGDWVRLLVKFPHHCEYCGQGCGQEGKTAWEFLTAKISAVNAAASLVSCRVLSVPAQTAAHTLAFDDELTLRTDYVLDYTEMPTAPVVEPTTGRVNYGTAAEEHLLTGVKPEPKAINAEDQRLRDAAQQLPPLAPVAGHRYWLRNGAAVEVWTQRAGVFLGKVLEGGQEVEWTATGTHAGGNRDYDIVQRDPTAKEVLA